MADRPDHTDPRYDPLKRVVAKRLYEEDGLSVRGVARAMDVSIRRAWEYLHDAGVVMRTEGRPRKEAKDERPAPDEGAPGEDA